MAGNKPDCSAPGQFEWQPGNFECGKLPPENVIPFLRVTMQTRLAPLEKRVASCLSLSLVLWFIHSRPRRMCVSFERGQTCTPLPWNVVVSVQTREVDRVIFGLNRMVEVSFIMIESTSRSSVLGNRRNSRRDRSFGIVPPASLRPIWGGQSVDGSFSSSLRSVLGDTFKRGPLSFDSIRLFDRLSRVVWLGVLFAIGRAASC